MNKSNLKVNIAMLWPILVQNYVGVVTIPSKCLIFFAGSLKPIIRWNYKMHKICSYIKRQKKNESYWPLGWSLVNIKVSFRRRGNQWKACNMFASIFLKYCIYMRFSTSLWAQGKAQSDFSGVLFSSTIKWNDLDKFTSVRNYIFSV